MQGRRERTVKILQAKQSQQAQMPNTANAKKKNALLNIVNEQRTGHKYPINSDLDHERRSFVLVGRNDFILEGIPESEGQLGD